MIRKLVIYSGRVQGVGFRYTTQRIARKFAVTGTVRNLADGNVEVVVEGEAGEVGRFLAAVAERMRENIDDVRVTDSAATGEFASFEIAY